MMHGTLRVASARLWAILVAAICLVSKEGNVAEITTCISSAGANASVSIAGGASAVPRDLPLEIEEKLDAILRSSVASIPLAGLTVGVERAGKTLFIRAYGHSDVAAGVAAKEDTVYRIGSITKEFTAAATMQLVERGKIGLDDPVADYLQRWPGAWGAKIRVRHLLNHTSGLPDYIRLPMNRFREYSTEELVSICVSRRLLFSPGARMAYSNSNYALLGAIIEKVSAVSFDDYLQEYVCEPIGLRYTSLKPLANKVPATGHAYESGRFVPTGSIPSSFAFAAGGLFSSVPDLLLWQRALVQGAVVSRKAYEQMTAPETLSSGETLPYGYGFWIGRPHMSEVAVAHGGSIRGFSGFLVYYPKEDMALALLSNTKGAASNLSRLSDAVASALLAQSQ